MEPTIRQLEYLVALADARHFGRAAESCQVSQPTLSVQIGQLERGMGLELFERTSKGVRLTIAGRTAIERAREVLRSVEEFQRAIRAHAEHFTGPFLLGAIPTIAPYLFPHWVPRLRCRYPDLVPRLREEKTADLVAKLNAGTLDLAILAYEAEIGDVATAPIGWDPFLFLGSPDHPLSSRKRLKEEDIAEETLLYLDDGHCFRDQARSICRGRGREPDFSASSLGTLIEMVAAGAGATLIPAMALASVADRPLAAVPFVKTGPGRTVALAWRKNSPDAARFLEIAELFQQHRPPGLLPVTEVDSPHCGLPRNPLQ